MSDARPGPHRSVVVAVSLLAYVGGLAVVGLWPTAVDRDADRLVDATLAALPFLTYARLEWLANVLLFVPAGLLGALLWRRRTAIVVVPCAGLALSALLETVQSGLLPGRVGSVLDILANTLGALLGCLLGIGLARLRERRRARAGTLAGEGSGSAHAPVVPAGGAPGGGVEAVAPVDDHAARDEARGVLG